MDVEIKAADDSGEMLRVLAVNAANTVCVWAYVDTPLLYRSRVTLPSDVKDEDALVARIPAGYNRDIEHITRDPYFAPKFLDIYVLTDGSTLYVGA